MTRRADICIITGADYYNNCHLARNGLQWCLRAIRSSIRYCVVVRASKSILGPLQIQILYRQEPGRSIPDKSPFSLKVFPWPPITQCGALSLASVRVESNRGSANEEANMFRWIW